MLIKVGSGQPRPENARGVSHSSTHEPGRPDQPITQDVPTALPITPMDAELKARLLPLVARMPPGGDAYGPLRRVLETLDLRLLPQARALFVEGFDEGTRHRIERHPACRGTPTVEKLIAIASGEAGRWPIDPAVEGGVSPELEAERERARERVARLAALDLGTGPVIGPDDRDLWLHRALFVEEVLGHLEGDDEHAGLYLEAAKHFGFEVVQTAEIQSVWDELALLQRLALFGPRAMRPYLELHGLHRFAWAVAKLGERVASSPELVERIRLRPDFAAALSM